MATDPIRDYQHALRDLDAATKHVEGIVTKVHDVSSRLTHWQNVRIIGATTFDLDLVDATTIDARGWPSIEELGHALVDWHKRHDQVEQAWNRLDQVDRVGLQTPPTRRLIPSDRMYPRRPRTL